jgi:protein HIRA/HIR1
MCRSRDGLTLYGCSQDGSICAITFDEPELPGRGDDADTKRVLEESYSFKPNRAVRTLPAIEAGNGFPVAPAGQPHAGAAATSAAVNVIQPRKKKAGDSRKLTTYLKQADERNSNPLAQVSSGSRSSTGLQPPQTRVQPLPPPAMPNVSDAASAFADAPLQPLDTPSQAQASRDRMFQDAPNQVFARDREDLDSPRLGTKRKSSVQAEERVPKGRTMGASRPNTDIKEIRAPRAGTSTLSSAGSSGYSGSIMPVLPLPAVQSVVRALLDDTAYIEASNAEDNKGKNKVVYSQGGQNMWMDYLGGAVLGLAVTKMFAAAGCEDGLMVAYSPAGRRYVHAVKGWLLSSTSTDVAGYLART